MARCEVCDKGRLSGNKVTVTRSNVSGRTRRSWKPNIKRARINDNGTVKTINICTKCLRSGKVTRAL